MTLEKFPLRCCTFKTLNKFLLLFFHFRLYSLQCLKDFPLVFSFQIDRSSYILHSHSKWNYNKSIGVGSNFQYIDLQNRNVNCVELGRKYFLSFFNFIRLVPNWYQNRTNFTWNSVLVHFYICSNGKIVLKWNICLNAILCNQDWLSDYKRCLVA